METNRYTLAGWLAIVNVGLGCLSLVIGFVVLVITAKLRNGAPPPIGPGTLLDIASVIIGIYIALKWKELLHERYSFHEIDGLIWAGIIWSVVTYIGIFALNVLGSLAWQAKGAHIVVSILMLAFAAVAAVFIGIVNIMSAVRLMRIKEQVSGPFCVCIYSSLIAGILQVTVIFAIFSLLLLPVMMIAQAMVFLREEPQVEFV